MSASLPNFIVTGRRRQTQDTKVALDGWFLSCWRRPLIIMHRVRFTNGLIYIQSCNKSRCWASDMGFAKDQEVKQYVHLNHSKFQIWVRRYCCKQVSAALAVRDHQHLDCQVEHQAQLVGVGPWASQHDCGCLRPEGSQRQILLLVRMSLHG